MTPNQVARLRILEREINLTSHRARLDAIELAFLHDQIRQEMQTARRGSTTLVCYNVIVLEDIPITEPFIRAVVTDCDGNPLAGVDVELYTAPATLVDSGVTDADGIFVFSGVDPDLEDYFIRWSYGTSTDDTNSYDLDTAAADIVFQLDISSFPTVDWCDPGDTEDEIGYDSNRVPKADVPVYWFDPTAVPVPTLPGDIGNAIGTSISDSDGVAEFCIDPSLLDETGQILAAIENSASATVTDLMSLFDLEGELLYHEE